MTALQVITILFLHFVADFILQTRYQAENKYYNINALVGHTLVYSLVVTVFITLTPFMLITGWDKIITFFVVTFMTHSITDAITSNVSRQFYKKQNMFSFWVTIGFDQFLHFVQLFVLYQWLI